MSTTETRVHPHRRHWLRVWPPFLHQLERWRSRQHLARLDDHLLRDIGLTREIAEAEARLPPWDAPKHWFR